MVADGPGWSVVDGRLRAESLNGQTSIRFGSSDWSDVVISADVRFIDSKKKLAGQQLSCVTPAQNLPAFNSLYGLTQHAQMALSLPPDALPTEEKDGVSSRQRLPLIGFYLERRVNCESPPEASGSARFLMAKRYSRLR